MQLVFQDPFASLNPIHTVRHHLIRPLQLRLDHPRGAALEAAVHELLRSVNLTPPDEIAGSTRTSCPVASASGWPIARALATDPDVLLADEPVSMLDVSIRLEILNLLDRLKQDRNLALLYVTHDLATARHFSSEIMVMYRGEIVEHGPSDEVILRPSHPYTQILSHAAPDPTQSRAALAAARRHRQAARAARDAERRESTVDVGCRFRSRCPFAMDICATRPPDLSVAPGHLARCWLFGSDAEPAGAPAERGRPRRQAGQ